MRTKWVVLIERDELVQGVKAGLLNQVVAHPAVLHLVVNAAMADGVNTTVEERAGNKNKPLHKDLLPLLVQNPVGTTAVVEVCGVRYTKYGSTLSA